MTLRSREFPWAQRGDAIYLNAASTGPLPQRAVDALTQWANLRATMHLLKEELQFKTLARSRELAAKLIGASAREIALATNTGYGVNLAARALPLSPGDVILTPDLEFPANVYPWMGAAIARGLEYRRLPLPDGLLDEDALLRAIDDPAVKCLSVSWVGFMTGYRADLERIGRACRERGIYFVVDAIQGIGAFTLDVRAAFIDILACGGHGASGPRPGARRARARVCPSHARARRAECANHRAPCPPGGDRAGAHRGDARRRGGDHG